MSSACFLNVLTVQHLADIPAQVQGDIKEAFLEEVAFESVS